MPAKLRKATGVRELSPGVFDLNAPAGKDPLTGRYRQVHKRFRGTLREAKLARAEFVAEVKRGRYGATAATVDELCQEWLKELERKDRSPRTIDDYRRRYRHDIQPTLGSVRVSKVTTKMLTDLYGAHQRAGAVAGVGAQDPRHDLVDDEPGLPVGLARQQPGRVGRPTSDREPNTYGARARRCPGPHRGGQGLPAPRARER